MHMSGWYKVIARDADAEGLTYVFEIRRWHPSWWLFVWQSLISSGMPWWGPLTWAACLVLIFNESE